MIKNKYEELLKAERDRIKGTSFLPSYGKMPVHNEKFNKLMNYLEKVNNNLQVANPTEYQVNLQNLIQKQLDQARLDILLNDLEKFRKMKGDPSLFDKLLFASGFRAWCGAGTDIYANIKKDLDDPNRMFKIDTICRNHDIAYTKSKTIEDMKKADADMVFDIIEKYVVNLRKNFITGDYKSDFSNFDASYNTVYNYIVSVIEGSVNMFMMYEALKNIGGNIMSVANFGTNQLLNYFLRSGLIGGNQQIVGAGINEADLNEHEVMGYLNLIGDVPKIGKTVGSYYFGTMIRDRIFAMGGLLGIVYKTVIEELFDIEILSPTKHEVTDEDLQNIINTFEQLQNEYQKDTNQEPAIGSTAKESLSRRVKIGNEWKQEPTEIIPIDKLNDDLKDIFNLNATYIEKVKNIVSEPIEVVEYVEPVEEQSLTEEEEKILKELIELRNYFIKLESEDNYIMTPYPDLPSTEPISDNTKRPIVPDIEKDIKDAKQSSMLYMPDVEYMSIQQNTDTGQDLKPNEIKNKMEL
jgi:hypothetical protein